MQDEFQCTCPHCWQTFPILLDLSAGSQAIIYDCEVCCNPLEIAYEVGEGTLLSADVQPLGQ